MKQKSKETKKGEMSDFAANMLFGLICIVLIAIVWGINYLMEEFELYDIFLNFNIIVLILLPIYYGANYLVEKIRLLKIEKTLVQDKIDLDYHRDIIEQYSPGVLSLVYDGKISYDKDLMLSILHLKNKGYIDIVDDYKIVLTGKDGSDLNSNLQKILENHDVFLDNDLSIEVNGKREKTRAGKFHFDWSEAIFKDAVKEGLVQERKEAGGFLRYWLSIVLLLESIFLFMSGNDEYMVLWLFSVVLAFVTWILKFLSFTRNQYPKTQKGYEIYAKLKGLKNYIKDYSKLKDKTLEEIELWEDYVIYTAMFNFNTKLNIDAREIYQRIKLRANHKN